MPLLVGREARPLTGWRARRAVGREHRIHWARVPRLPQAATSEVPDREDELSLIGDDWAEDHHDVEVQDETGRRDDPRRAG
ncbi:hypothetical protein [Streptomyces marianii]|uniref:hypothetical protein n=1 Tax=Streptomyces marianii TaxID=1817406 RepID=UPI0014874284|nr:hypothetical protein [Streptomyces marianii]